MFTDLTKEGVEEVISVFEKELQKNSYYTKVFNFETSEERLEIADILDEEFKKRGWIYETFDITVSGKSYSLGVTAIKEGENHA